MAAMGLFVELEAKPDREDHVAALLRGALPVVEQEEQTTAWFAVRMGPSCLAIFDAFQDEQGASSSPRRAGRGRADGERRRAARPATADRDA